MSHYGKLRGIMGAVRHCARLRDMLLAGIGGENQWWLSTTGAEESLASQTVVWGRKPKKKNVFCSLSLLRTAESLSQPPLPPPQPNAPKSEEGAEKRVVTVSLQLSVRGALKTERSALLSSQCRGSGGQCCIYLGKYDF